MSAVGGYVRQITDMIGLKIPIGGKAMAKLVATKRVPEIIAPLGLDRFRLDRCVSERASAGTH